MQEKLLTDSIKQILRIDSSESAAKKDMPFGEGVYNTLRFYLELAESFGLSVKNYDNYAGEVIFGDESAEAVAVLCHLDTVPAGEGWTYPPFGGEEHSGRIYGRGATDNKGPAVICLYVLKELLNEGFKPSKCVKLIVGCDEESGWECIKHYNKYAEMPETGFSPDAEFPVIYAEKGILHIETSFKCEGIKSIKGGSAPNMVCGYAEAECEINGELLKKYRLTQEDGKIVSRGKSAHGSTPDEGKNAIEPLLKYLKAVGCIDGQAGGVLFEDKLGLKNLKDETGSLTMSPNMIFLKGNNLKITVDIRYPATLEQKAVTDILDSAINYSIDHAQPPLYIDKEDKLVKTLLKIYNEETGSRGKPIAIGGGTYARALKKGVGFGPELAGDKSGVHQPNEYIEVSRIKKLFDIYYRAIKELIK